MMGPGYDIQVPWSVRFTWSGDFLHDAYWSVGEQGFTNVSHGCVNLSPAHAPDVLRARGPRRPGHRQGQPAGRHLGQRLDGLVPVVARPLAGSALHMAVRTGPQGSTFVGPTTLRPSTAKSPLDAPKKGNAAAG